MDEKKVTLTEKQAQVVNYLKENGEVQMAELCAAFDTDEKHLGPVITTLGVKGPRAKGLVDYRKETVDGVEKPVKYVFLTEAGAAYEA